MDIQIKVFRAQVILAEKSHLPLVLHSRGTHAFAQMHDVLSTRLNIKRRVQWHCVNANSDLSTLAKGWRTSCGSEVSTGQDFLSCPASYLRPGGRQDRTKTKNASCPTGQDRTAH